MALVSRSDAPDDLLISGQVVSDADLKRVVVALAKAVGVKLA